MAEDLYKNADPGHCCLCGTVARQDLCSKCYTEHKDPVTGYLPNWLHVMRNDQNRQAKQRRHIQEVHAGLCPKTLLGAG